LLEEVEGIEKFLNDYFKLRYLYLR